MNIIYHRDLMKTKICSLCKQDKPLTEYHTTSKNKKTGKRYLACRCKTCVAAESLKWYKAQSKEYKQQAWERHKKHPDAKLWYMRGYLKKYQLTPDQFFKMVADQDNKCAICQIEFSKTPHVDHCHATNIVRKLLCSHCNRLLGEAKECIIILNNAINYLKEQS
jgi:hypothetical protein